MSEVSPTQTHDGMGALRAGNTVESLRPRQGFEINKDGAEQVSQRPRFEVIKNDFVMLEPEALPEPTVSQYFEDISQNPHIKEQLADQGLKLNLPEPLSVEFTAGVGDTFDGAAITDSNPESISFDEFLKETESEFKATQGYEFTNADIELLFWTVTQLVGFVDALQSQVDTLESRIENHNVRGSHKI